MRHEIGTLLIGLSFTGLGIAALIAGESARILPLVITVIGLVFLVFGILQVTKAANEKSPIQARYDRVDREKSAKMSKKRTKDSNEAEEDYVCHFAGRKKQNQVMKTADGRIVYEAICGKRTLKDIQFCFVDHLSGEESMKHISDTLSISESLRESFSITSSLTFKVDGASVWDVIADMGYGFTLDRSGFAPHYSVQRWSKDAGFIECGGTGLIHPKLRDKALGNMPTRGIYRIRCKRSDVPGFFLICFALSRTEENVYDRI